MDLAGNLESDPRFPSGRWGGFFTDKRIPGKHQMELALSFSQGSMTGSGRDVVGEFVIEGTYHLNDGLCAWIKQYVGMHSVGYRGFNEGKGIWGAWEMNDRGVKYTGGFHIWPEGMPDPTEPALSEEAEPSAPVENKELAPMGV